MCWHVTLGHESRRRRYPVGYNVQCGYDVRDHSLSEFIIAASGQTLTLFTTSRRNHATQHIVYFPPHFPSEVRRIQLSNDLMQE